jgi:hypothetical protein
MAMQINRVGVGLIVFFGLFGLGMAVVPIAIGADAQVAGILASIGVIWVLVALGGIWFTRRQKAKAAHQDWIFQNGITGTATVLDASSNTTVNEMPLLKLKLDLAVPGMGQRQVSRRELVSVFAARRFEPGLVLAVHVNPEDPEDFILVW